MTCAFQDIVQEEAMRHLQYTLTPAHVHAHTTYRLQKHLRLKDHGPKCRVDTLWTVLCYAASRIISLAAGWSSLRDAPSDSRIRRLARLLPNSAEAGCLGRRTPG